VLLLATFDLLAERVGAGASARPNLASGGDLEDRTARIPAGVRSLREPGGAMATVLVIVESQNGRRGGAVCACASATVTCEQLLCRSFIDAPGAMHACRSRSCGRSRAALARRDVGALREREPGRAAWTSP